MKWIAIPLVGFALFQAYNMGWAQAVKRHPEYRAIKEADRKADEQFWKEVEASETDRDRLCYQLFDDVQDILHQESLLP